MKSPNKPMRHVLIVESNSLLNDGVESLLKQAGRFRVTGIAYVDDPSFVQEVSGLQPDVIVLNEGGPLDSNRLLTLLKNLPALATVRVITIRADDNTIDMIALNRVVASRTGDLFDLIHGNRDER